MSYDDLRAAIKRLEKPPQTPIMPTPTETLASEGRDIDAIVSHREIEDAYNDAIQDDILKGGVIYQESPFVQQPEFIDPVQPIADPTDIDLGAPANYDSISRDFNKAMFALDYTNRLIRSTMAITGLSARTQRFNDIRKSSGFWVAMMDASLSASDLSHGKDVMLETSPKTKELVEKVPAVLTDPDVEASELPGIGSVATAVGAPEQLEWMYDMAGEILIEGKATGAVKKLAKKGMSKFAKKTVEAGAEVAAKGGVKRVLSSIGNDELRAIAAARKAQRVGLLGSRPAQKEIDNAVNNTFDYIKDTAEARLTKKEAIKVQRRAGAARMYDVQGDGYGVGYVERLRKAGTTKKTQSSFKPFIDTNPGAADDLVTLQKTIDNYDFGGSKIYTTTNAQEAIDKLYVKGELLTAGDVEHLRDIFGNEFANSLTKFTKKPSGVLGKTFDLGVKSIKGMNSTARTLMTTGELSFLLRQGNYRAWSRPQDAIRSFVVASKALISPKYARYWDEAMRASKNGRRAVDSGLFLGKVGDYSLSPREEFFNSEWLHKVPVLGRGVKRFEDGYVAGLNQLRLDWFDEGMKVIDDAGRAGDEGLVTKWADYVNNMTGRADLEAMIEAGNFGEADKVMKQMVDVSKEVMFAPRFAVSKWNRHLVSADLIFGNQAPAGIRRMLVEDTVTKWRRYQRLQHYATQGGYTVETDPRSSDFLKIKRGSTRFDVLGGDAQIAVLLGRLATGETKDTSTGEIKKAVAEKIIQEHAAGKLNPAMSLIYDKFVAQQTFDGKDIDDPEVLLKEVATSFVPLYIQDVHSKIFNGYEKEGLTMAESIEQSFDVVTMGFLGAGIQTYPPSARKELEMMYNDKSQAMFARDLADIPLDFRNDVIYAAELDNPELVDKLKSEIGMQVMSPGAAAKVQEQRNKSFRKIRSKLGPAYNLFEDSNVNTGFISTNIGDIRLNFSQHNKLQNEYVKSIKRQLSEYPDMSILPAGDAKRRMMLQDIIDMARQEARDQLSFDTLNER